MLGGALSRPIYRDNSTSHTQSPLLSEGALRDHVLPPEQRHRRVDGRFASVRRACSFDRRGRRRRTRRRRCVVRRDARKNLAAVVIVC
jgi:hypothetical protein